MVYYIYVIAKGGRLVGALSLRQLILAQPEQLIGDLAATNLVKVRLNSSRDEIVDSLTRYDLLAVPVVDNDMVLRGIITHDQIADIISEEAAEDMYALSGIRGGDEESEWDMGPWSRTKRRLPWLIVCIFGGLAAGMIIDFFSDALATVVALSFFIPIQMDTGGNVATQSVAIAVRGLATGELSNKDVVRFCFREVPIGIMIGLACGLTISISAVVIWNESPLLGLAVGTAMAIATAVSASIGAFIPMMSHRYNVDPAVTSGPLVTSIMDILGLFVYFSSAVLILGLQI
jgi:magnesium transporter